MLFVQAMNILIVNQSVIDMCASFITLLTAVVEVDSTRMSRDSIYDQFVCRVWITRTPIWSVSVTSTYGILITAFERYFAVIYPIWYKVRILLMKHRANSFFCCHTAVTIDMYSLACLCGSLAQCALSLKQLSAGPGFNPQTRQNKLARMLWD